MSSLLHYHSFWKSRVTCTPLKSPIHVLHGPITIPNPIISLIIINQNLFSWTSCQAVSKIHYITPQAPATPTKRGAKRHQRCITGRSVPHKRSDQPLLANIPFLMPPLPIIICLKSPRDHHKSIHGTPQGRTQAQTPYSRQSTN